VRISAIALLACISLSAQDNAGLQARQLYYKSKGALETDETPKTKPETETTQQQQKPQTPPAKRPRTPPAERTQRDKPTEHLMDAPTGTGPIDPRAFGLMKAAYAVSENSRSVKYRTHVPLRSREKR